MPECIHPDEVFSGLDDPGATLPRQAGSHALSRWERPSGMPNKGKYPAILPYKRRKSRVPENGLKPDLLSRSYLLKAPFLSKYRNTG